MIIITIFVLILTLAVLVLSHEFGHFYTAKRFGIKVLEFGFGLPPKIWGKMIGETIYSLNWLPIGGFVRLYGEDETNKEILNDKKSFAAHPVWQRIVVVVAGVIMNLLLAVILFYIVLGAENFKQDIPLLTPFHFVGVTQTNETKVYVGGVSKNSPAANAKIKSGDQILSINGEILDSSNKLIEVTKNHAGKKVSLVVEDPSGQNRTVVLVPRMHPPKGEGAMGVLLEASTIAHLNYSSLPQRLASGFTHSYNIGAYSLVIFAQLIEDSIKAHTIQPLQGNIAGPVGITKIAGLILQTSSPLVPYLSFIALLSLNLALVNILPFPALDGGRLFFLLIEAIFRRRVNAEVERLIHSIGMVVLIALIIAVTYLDITRSPF